MRIKKLEWKFMSDIKPTDIEIKPEDKKEIDHWATTARAEIEGTKLLGIVLSLVGKYKFTSRLYSTYCSKTECNTAYQILKEKQALVEIGLKNEDPANRLSITIVDGSTMDVYSIWVASQTIMIIPEKTEDLLSGFEQKYHNSIDEFSMPMNNKKIQVFVHAGQDTKEFYLLPSSFKDLFKATIFNDIMDVYHFLEENLPPELKSFRIEIYEDHNRTDFINMQNGEIKEVEFTKVINGNKTKIYQDLSNPKQDESYREAARSLERLKRSHELHKQLEGEN